MRNNKYLFTSESVSEGHPDKVCDRISDMVVDSYLSKDPFSRVACETLTTTNKVVLAGEIRGPKIEKDEIVSKVRDCIKDIGYDQDGFSWKTANVETFLHEQSKDIAMGVDSKDNKDEGAGDQGIMFGYACNETEELMPAPIYFSHKILRLMAEDRKSEVLKGIEPDSKSQVTMLYENEKPIKVTSVVISTQHSKDLNQEKVKELSIEEKLKISEDKLLRSLAEIENIALSIKGVKNVIAVPKKNEFFGFKINLYVELELNYNNKEIENKIISLFNNSLSKNEMPENIKFVKKIKKTLIGKNIKYFYR